jgi:F-type H+-transporting ATPase subunit a
MSFNPFHQFEVHSVADLSLLGHDISLTNSGIFMLAAVICVSSFFYFSMRKARLVPTKLQSTAELIFQFAESTLIETAGNKAKAFVPFIFTLFTFILALNLFGMLPYGFTVTSQIIVNFALAAVIFFMVIIIGFVKHGLHYLSLFLPEGTPKALAPLIIIIELLSFLARPVTLTMRLAGNMLAGHVLLKVLASFVIMMGMWGFFPIPFIIIMSGFEIFVAVLQAYIFTILTCVYLNDAVNLH